MKKSLLLVLSVILAFSLSARNLADYRIGIDPGHGGNDGGAEGPSAPHEATLCLRAALELRSRLQSDGAPIMMTRESDVNPSLDSRAWAFQQYDPYIALSMHLNAFNGSAYGTEALYRTGESSALAQYMFNELVSYFRDGKNGYTPAPTRGGSTFARGLVEGRWAVLAVGSNIPATLTEGLFVDNSSEHSYLCSDAGFDTWVTAHLNGCYAWLHDKCNGEIPSTPPSISPDTENPVIHRGIVVQNDHNSFYAYAYATDNKAVSSVKFPTWTSNNDQDDIKWYEGENGSWTINGQTYNYHLLCI